MQSRVEQSAESVVLALVATRETANAAQLPQAQHPVTAASQDLVRIGLVTDIPDQPVMRRVEYIVQSNSQLDRTEIGGEMAAGLGHAVEHETA